ncbi:MAG TPA: hypothetical protein VIJ92_08165 [Ginsengibacter sp.]
MARGKLITDVGYLLLYGDLCRSQGTAMRWVTLLIFGTREGDG